jgi:asparagine synthase (glutamine-hydrolysing)
MACGLEVRAPFLDAELVDAIARCRGGSNMVGDGPSGCSSARRRVGFPQPSCSGPKKGFGIPVARWLRGPLTGLLDELLGPDRLRRQGLFRPDEVARRIGEHRDGVRDHRKPLWTLLMFQLWHDHWLNRH